MALRTISSLRVKARNIGKSIRFNGTTDYLTFPFTPSNTGFSVAFFVCPEGITANRQILSWNSASANDGFSIGVSGVAGTSNLGLTVRNGSTTDVFSYAGNKGIKGKWIHVVVTYKQNEAKLYFNSVLSITDSACSMTQATGFPFTMGRSSNTSANFFSGKVADLVFKNDSQFTQQEIDNLYFRGVYPSNLTARYDFNDSLSDKTGNGNDLSIGSGTSYSTDVPISTRSNISSNRINLTGRSIYFNGTSSYITCGTDNIGSPFSVGMWIKWLGNTGGAQALITKRTSFAAGSMVFQLYINSGAGGDIRIIGNAGAARTFGPYQPPIGIWTHIAYVWDGTAAANSRLYVNGALQSNASGGVTLGTGTTAPIVIGADQSPAQEFFYGYMADVFILNRALSTTEIAAINGNNKARMWSSWNFRESNGQTAKDYFGRRTATLYNCVFNSSFPYSTTRSAV